MFTKVCLRREVNSRDVRKHKHVWSHRIYVGTITEKEVYSFCLLMKTYYRNALFYGCIVAKANLHLVLSNC